MSKDYIKGHVWKLYPDYDIFLTDLQTGLLEQLTSFIGYDAEATVAFNGSKIIYTSMVRGDLGIWTMDLEGKNKVQLTNELGYDEEAFLIKMPRKLFGESII